MTNEITKPSTTTWYKNRVVVLIEEDYFISFTIHGKHFCANGGIPFQRFPF
ncbi:MAG: hypothetical protein IPG89_15410 [Bacteroidetes bacterium]|nr:hypothetical protein [Bacteroidota bacterium]